MKERASQTQIQQPPTPSRTTWLQAWKDLLRRPSLETTPTILLAPILELQYSTRKEILHQGLASSKAFLSPHINSLNSSLRHRWKAQPQSHCRDYLISPSISAEFPLQSSNKEPHVHIAPLTYTGIQQSFIVILAVQSIHPITACDLVGYPLLSLTDLHCHRACKAHCSTQQPRSILIFLEGANKLSTWIHNVEDLHLEVTNI